MAKARAKVTTKVKKKFWFPVLAPKAFNNAKLGEMYLIESTAAIGRTFWHSLRELNENMRDQNTYLNFKIKSGVDKSLNTEVVGYKLAPVAFKRMVRRHNDRCDDSFVLKTSDNKKVRIKTIIVTAHNTKHSIGTRLRKAMLAKLTDDVKKINFGNLIDKLISHKMQIEMKKTLTKLYPVKVFEIKYVGLERDRYGKTDELESEEMVEEGVEKVAEEVKEEAAEVVKEDVKEVVEEAKEEVKKAVEKAPETAEVKE